MTNASGEGPGLYFRVFECDDAPGGDSNYEEHWLWLDANGTTIMRRTPEKAFGLRCDVKDAV